MCLLVLENYSNGRFFNDGLVTLLGYFPVDVNSTFCICKVSELRTHLSGQVVISHFTQTI